MHIYTVVKIRVAFCRPLVRDVDGYDLRTQEGYVTEGPLRMEDSSLEVFRQEFIARPVLEGNRVVNTHD